jgi:hypothetical protein
MLCSAHGNVRRTTGKFKQRIDIRFAIAIRPAFRIGCDFATRLDSIARHHGNHMICCRP